MSRKAEVAASKPKKALRPKRVVAAAGGHEETVEEGDERGTASPPAAELSAVATETPESPAATCKETAAPLCSFSLSVAADEARCTVHLAAAVE